jgi:hypothetical protein
MTVAIGMGHTMAGERAHIHRVSTVLDLEGLDAENQLRSAVAFLGGLLDVDRDHWNPMLVVDEAQLCSVTKSCLNRRRRICSQTTPRLLCMPVHGVIDDAPNHAKESK